MNKLEKEAEVNSEKVTVWHGVNLSDCTVFTACPERLEAIRKITNSKYCLPLEKEGEKGHGL